MAEVTLVHCTPVPILDPLDEPGNVNLGFAVGGSAGDGRVEVSGGPGELPAPIALPAGSSGAILLPKVTTLSVHYHRAAGGPPSISFSSTVTVLP